MPIRVALLAYLSCVLMGTDLGRKIEKINDSVKAMRNKDDCESCEKLQSYSAGQDSKTKMRDCVQSICAKKTYIPQEILRQAMQRAATPNPAFERDMQPLINRASRQNALYNLKEAQGSLRYLDHPPKNPEASIKRIYSFMAAMTNIQKFKFKEDDAGNLTIQLESSRKVFPSLSDEHFKQEAATATKFMALLEKNEPFETDDVNALRLMFTEEQMRGKQIAIMADITRDLAAIQQDPNLAVFKKIPNFFKSVSPEKFVKFFKEDPFDREGIDELENDSALLKVLRLSSTDPEFKKLLESSEVDIKQFASDHNIVATLNLEVVKQKSALAAKNIVSHKCRYAYELAHKILPSAKDLAAVGPAIENMKMVFGDQTQDLICKERQADYHDQVKTWQPKLPQTVEQFDQAMKIELQSSYHDDLMSVKAETEIDALQGQNSFRLASVAMVDADKIEPTSDVDDACTHITPKILPDRTMYSSNGFVIGPSVVSRPVENQGVTFHELGHKLWAYFVNENSCDGARKWFGDVRACLRQNHKELTTAEVQSQSDRLASGKMSQFEEEDWADLVSAKVDDKANNLACLFTNGLSEDGYQSLSLINSDATDVHSSDLFRLLHFTYLKTGSIPEVCNEALHDKGENAAFKKCI